MKKKIFIAILIILGSVGASLSAWAATSDTFIVTSRQDSGAGTLRQAIDASNTTTGIQTITFNIAGPNSITAWTDLEINAPIIIDGNKTQIVGKYNNMESTSGVLKLNAGSDGSIIKNISVVSSYIGIRVESGNNTISGCAIGIDWADTGRGNYLAGILILATVSDITIGGTSVTDRNIVSSNMFGIRDNGSTNLKIMGNYIGTNAAGSAAASLQTVGLFLLGGLKQARIGGNYNLSEGNLISGNYQGIVLLDGSNQGNSICGNVIGLNAAQTSAIANSYGIYCSGWRNNVGLPQVGYHNVVAGNTVCGVYMTGSGALNSIQNNLIGINSSGVKIANEKGIWLDVANSNQIGGGSNSNLYERNVVSGNNIGICIDGYGNTVSGNFVGTDITGMGAVGNNTGIQVIRGNGNLIGGSNANAADLQGNIVSGQTLGNGIVLTGGRGNSICGNTIGLNLAKDAAIPNQIGISLAQGNTNTSVGGTSDSLRNIISGNSDYGISALKSMGHVIAGNYLGFNGTGTGVLKNSGGSIRLADTAQCKVGGTSANQRNFLVGDTYGIVLNGSSAYGNSLCGNWLGVMPSGSTAPLSFGCAISISASAHDNYIGQKNGAGNLLTAMADGIRLTGVDTDRNCLLGNTLTAFTGNAILLANDGANDNQPAPAIYSAEATEIKGTANPFDYIEVFLANRVVGQRGGASSYVGSALADAAGAWTLSPVSLIPGQVVCALATSSTNNTSGFSLNVQIAGAIPTSTPTPQATSTPTPTCTPVPMNYSDFEGQIISKNYIYAAPNPIQGSTAKIYVYCKQRATGKIKIFTLLGREVLSIERSFEIGRNVETIYVGNLANGAYYLFVRVRNDEGLEERAKTKIALLK